MENANPAKKYRLSAKSGIYILLISTRVQGNYNALTNHMWGLMDIANPAKKYRLLAKSGIYS